MPGTQLYFAYNQGDPATLDNIDQDRYQAFRYVQVHGRCHAAALHRAENMRKGE